MVPGLLTEADHAYELARKYILKPQLLHLGAQHQTITKWTLSSLFTVQKGILGVFAKCSFANSHAGLRVQKVQNASRNCFGS